ncbi:MAG: hypothetical protein Q9191_005806 [Dirinaria sp. TL-2023a]
MAPPLMSLMFSGEAVADDRTCVDRKLGIEVVDVVGDNSEEVAEAVCPNGVMPGVVVQVVKRASQPAAPVEQQPTKVEVAAHVYPELQETVLTYYCSLLPNRIFRGLRSVALRSRKDSLNPALDAAQTQPERPAVLRKLASEGGVDSLS